ncbi:TonB-dependent receptor [Stakelama tenebrarum]|uniref:TonB-dependent receptor n=1 Tax=Stakelama tenebrarum TaxID=2711215 RepID=A0A6G6Y399_9SPHN|nr:TonB-dependent receptor plug domain-containing protein [Sphingosinithalassobacter tenebrarum]QIG79402.1 TonB-dependent receptor [Sphingosinithalassobacter tenebrarum]
MNKLNATVSTVALLACFATPAAAQDATGAQDTTASQRTGGVQTIVVTATKRDENLQDVPIAVQALGGEQLDQLGVANFQDYLTELPNVTAGGGGPGQNTIYIRGLASTTPNLTTAGVAGLAPNVSLYLDEQPLSQPGRNLDVYAADLSRIEVLSGPQGTLFGASSQAGVIRMITNEPILGEFSGSGKAGVAFTKDGEMSANAEAVLNVPVTPTLAVRGVVYLDHQGGYIDNVAGTRDASESARFRDTGTVRYNGVPVKLPYAAGGRGGIQEGADLSGVNFIEANNAGLVQDNINDTTYSGFRVTALWEVTPDWSIKVAHTRQGLDSDGVFFEDPTLGDLEIQRFEQDRLEDDFSNTAWTVEGRLGALDIVYTGAYTDRETDQRVDYSDYLFVGQYLPYYICDGSVSYPGGAPSGTCQAPNLFVTSKSDTTKFTQELRFNTPQESRFRVTAGGFYSNLVLKERNDFHYPGSQYVETFTPGVYGFAPNYPFTTGYTSDPGPFPAGVIFRNDVKRTDEQFGLFGEASFDVVPEFLTATFGMRYYDVDVDLEGSANSSFCNLSGPNGSDPNGYGTDISDLYNGDGSYTDIGNCGPHTTYTEADITPATDPRIVAAINAPDTAHADGFIFKGTLTMTPAEGLLFYATYSEGFRPGLLNRPGGAQGPNGYTVPFAVATDEVANYEIGWKTQLFDNQLVFNGSAFYVDISKLQTTIFDPGIVNLFFSDNAADAEIWGVEGEITYAPYTMPGLTVSAAFSFLDTEITEVLTPTGDVHVGDSLAYAPEFQGNLRVRYEWDVSPDLTAHVMPTMAHSASKYTDIIDINRLQLDSWTTFGLSAGVSSYDGWRFEIYGENITDERAQLSGDFYYDRPRVVMNRPLTVGMRVGYDF